MVTRLRYSRQRELIRNCLKERKDHPTAEMLYEAVREIDPKISLGTVYRNLDLLRKLGEVQVLNAADGLLHFDACTRPHSHFYCRICRRLFDLENAAGEQLLKLALNLCEGRSENCILMVNGICADCLHEPGIQAGPAPKG